MERLQKVIAERGYCSRRKAEELIQEGRVALNGVIVRELGVKAEKDDEILIDGKPLEKEKKKVYYLLNKPKGVISSVKDDRGRKTVIDLLDVKERVYPLGRLDFDSSGLLILSNDGELMQKMIHPSFEITKVYEVTIDKLISDDEIRKLEAGVRIDDYVSAPCTIKLIRKNENKKISFLEVSIHEGKNREIRKMFETVRAKVTRLHRIEEAGITLGKLRSGEYRELRVKEVADLKRRLK
ncbi:MAG: rRNA pseudouridine synthase [Erysipelotrichaceae bacterium]|nr:rRNA pseudouridine synthase [Erysipelotrichaceae bacterium]